ncbi:roquin-1 isoform X2 [Bombyx mandarina]|uniref:RING-type E3 ubiquitin transferase n=2 Tax=Bombyx TaxID=7090 RepID=A0A8R2LYR6_BOMMO|nr:roquin-1 isoform X2 [Bombyx mandarina]XP_037869463.1 roquin-1 isoform X2 [Bombyx mori]
MPIQAPQWTDYLTCPVCCREFGAPPRSPISLSCGHTLCRHCLIHLHRKQCPFDQTIIQVEPEELVVNTALLQLAGYAPPSQPYQPPCIKALPESDRQAYDTVIRTMEELAVFLKCSGNANMSGNGNRLSRPMQRKLVTLLQCSITDEEGRGRAARAARSLGERTVTELILQHQNPQQLSANLWAAVRARGCQFLGPAMQEEVLKLVLLALEDGSALSRKVLVMFVVQRLEPHFPQASKTSIGHVVQLLYRASCFKVSKRESDSSLMQLKEEFRTYDSLRREHDAQIVQIATESGLRIAPDQWSALLYGDTAHKSHMQSIIDKLQTPQSFAQSVQELFVALQRTGDPEQLVTMSMHLDKLANIDANADAKSPTWKQMADVMTSLKEVVIGLINYIQQQAAGKDMNQGQKDLRNEPSTSQSSPQARTTPTPTQGRYKMAMCKDVLRSLCPRGNSCMYAHSEEELERYRAMMANINGHFQFMPGIVGVPALQHGLTPMQPGLAPILPGQPIHIIPNMYNQFAMPQHVDPSAFGAQSMQGMPPQSMQSQGIQPQSMQSQGIQPQSMQPQGTTLQSMQSQGMQPQSMQSQGIQSQSIQPQGVQPQSMQSQSIQPQSMQAQGIQTQSMQPQGLQSQPQGLRPVQAASVEMPELIDLQQNPNFVQQNMPSGPRRIYDLNSGNPNFNFAQQYQHPEYPTSVYGVPEGSNQMYMPTASNLYPFEDGAAPIQSPIDIRSELRSDIRVNIPAPQYPSMHHVPRTEVTWPVGPMPPISQMSQGQQVPPGPQVYAFENIRDALPTVARSSAPLDRRFPSDRRVVGSERGVPPPHPSFFADGAEDQLEEELLALERRIDTEFKSAD